VCGARFSRWSRRGGLGLAAIVLLVACGSSSDVTTGSSSSGTPLEGTSWELAPAAPLGVSLGQVVVTARFEAGTMSGKSGCNSYTAPYELSGSSLTIGPNIAGTKAACPAPETAVETAYLGRLPKVASYEIDGQTLTLADSGSTTILEYTATNQAEAIVGKWTVLSYYSGNAVTSVLGGADLTADFGGDGRIAGNTGCNSFNGPYEVNGDTIKIGPLASTKAACTSDELSKQEADYLNALQLATTFQVAGDRLDLFRPGGTYAVSFEKG
jgi:heat shock protein HslJ